jgi:hypothetical protein
MDIPTVTSLDAFEDAVWAFARGGSRTELMTKLFVLGLRADCIRYLAEYPGRTMMVRER